MSAFSIDRGNPSSEEVAIAITVLQAAASAGAAAAPTVTARSNWAAPARLHRPSTHSVGPAAWVLAQRIR